MAKNSDKNIKNEEIEELERNKEPVEKKREIKDRSSLIISRLENIVKNAKNVPLSQGMVQVNSEEMLVLLENLSDAVTREMKVYREVTDKQARIINEAKEEAAEILYEAEKSASRIRVSKRRANEPPSFKQSDLARDEKLALRTANDIYAASLIYTDEMLTEVDHLVNDAYEKIEQEYERVRTTLKQKIDSVSENKAELMKNLDELSATDRYSQILEISQLLSNELYREREKQRILDKDKTIQLEISFDEDGKPDLSKDKAKDREEINPDRSVKKTIEKHAESLDIKVRKREPIKEAVREAKSKIEKEKKEILKDEVSDYGDFE